MRYRQAMYVWLQRYKKMRRERDMYKEALEEIAGMAIQWEFDSDAPLLALKALEKYNA